MAAEQKPNPQITGGIFYQKHEQKIAIAIACLGFLFLFGMGIIEELYGPHNFVISREMWVGTVICFVSVFVGAMIEIGRLRKILANKI